MKTITSTAGHVRSAIYTLEQQLAKIEKMERVIPHARAVTDMWGRGCSFADLAPVMTELVIALKNYVEVGK